MLDTPLTTYDMGKMMMMSTRKYYAFTQHGNVRQILKQFKSISLGCEKVNVMNIHISVVSQYVVTARKASWNIDGAEPGNQAGPC